MNPLEKNQKMRILNSLKVPKNVKGGPLGFFNIQPVAKSRSLMSTKSRRLSGIETETQKAALLKINYKYLGFSNRFQNFVPEYF